jgi:NADH-quinone oxidoreductase subunit H
MRFAWLFLIPMTLVNIIVTGVALLLPIGTVWQIVVSAAANWVLLFLMIFAFRRITGVSPLGKTPRWIQRRSAATGVSGAAATPPAKPALASPVVEAKR